MKPTCSICKKVAKEGDYFMQHGAVVCISGDHFKYPIKPNQSILLSKISFVEEEARQYNDGSIQVKLLGRWITLTKYQVEKLRLLKILRDRGLATNKLYTKFYAKKTKS